MIRGRADDAERVATDDVDDDVDARRVALGRRKSTPGGQHSQSYSGDDGDDDDDGEDDAVTTSPRGRCRPPTPDDDDDDDARAIGTTTRRAGDARVERTRDAPRANPRRASSADDRIAATPNMSRAAWSAALSRDQCPRVKDGAGRSR
jgi:hypothetical protein